MDLVACCALPIIALIFLARVLPAWKRIARNEREREWGVGEPPDFLSWSDQLEWRHQNEINKRLKKDTRDQSLREKYYRLHGKWPNW